MLKSYLYHSGGGKECVNQGGEDSHLQPWDHASSVMQWLAGNKEEDMTQNKRMARKIVNQEEIVKIIMADPDPKDSYHLGGSARAAFCRVGILVPEQMYTVFRQRQ